MKSARLASVVIGVLALALWPLVTGKFGVDFVTKTMIYATFALSLELLVGTTGLVCFGQAAFFGLAGYAAVKLSPEGAAASLLWLLDPLLVCFQEARSCFSGLHLQGGNIRSGILGLDLFLKRGDITIKRRLQGGANVANVNREKTLQEK